MSEVAPKKTPFSRDFYHHLYPLGPEATGRGTGLYPSLEATGRGTGLYPNPVI